MNNMLGGIGGISTNYMNNTLLNDVNYMGTYSNNYNYLSEPSYDYNQEDI